MAGRDPEEYTDAGYGESSQYAAHLDRGWALLDRGDLAAARTSVAHAQEVRPDDPDSLVLQGAIALAEGNPEESLRCYERAIELDPEYLEPYTAAAQVCLFDIDDAERGLRHCEDALDLEHLAPFDLLDVHLLAAECELSLGEEAAGRARLAACPSIGTLDTALELASGEEDPAHTLDAEDPETAAAAQFLAQDYDGEPLEDEERVDRVARVFQFAMRLARLQLDLGQSSVAIELLRKLVQRFPSEADAWYLASEAEVRHGGDPRIGVNASLRALQLDARLELPGWLPSAAVIHRKVVSSLESAAEPSIRKLVEGETALPLFVLEQPSPELVAEGVDPRLMALALASRSPIHQDPGDAPMVLTGLAVYVRNILRYCRDAEQFVQEVRLAVLDELAMFLGLDDGRREVLGLPPAPTMAPVTEAAGGGGGSGGDGTSTATETETEEAKPKRRRKRRRTSRAN